MLKIVISGCNGRMGQVITSIVKEDPELVVAAGFDINAVKLSDYPVYADPMEYQGSADAIIDFSSPAALGSLLPYVMRRNIPLVLATTGYTSEQQSRVVFAAETVPIFQTANLSLGVNLLADLVSRAVSVLGPGYDIEIVERHHNSKVDAPSGTALMLAKTAAEARGDTKDFVYDRQSVRRKREKSEIGISAVRGGTIVGDHEVIFAGKDEVIELHHHASSKEIFAVGAVRAAKFMATQKKAGIYTMQDLLSCIL